MEALAGTAPVVQAAAGTLFTWGVTAAGAALVYVAMPSQLFLDTCLGFAAGVMLAASYWSLLAPSIEMAESSGSYGQNGELAFFPAAVGFVLGCVFVYGSEALLPLLGMDGDVHELIAHKKTDGDALTLRISLDLVWPESTCIGEIPRAAAAAASWRRTLLLALAVTIHNIPEGLAVGVGFGSVGASASATFANACNLALGIGIQNFPEGLAISLPLHRAGFSKWDSFWYGQMSGMVEPVAGVLGAAAVQLFTPILPYALAFAAGAMIYVVLDDIIPEICNGSHRTAANMGAVVGFVVMMCLDVGLG
ncbi:uncharacterized protein MONBRDRAFT_22254 [Monosiga brevicollis MX1]|uniref:Zinc transporter ZIP11 n=1 Tax=Monosiga brevicollis TaxID=81824 RepID=A9UQ12_MONBE|nr:uncharacterized protein MONBRDRAFT_22254 [Monosiga brevicollis MX1]EDQ92515.1 predicted protein [Monosiga brevicollis MX1]|eukprot:XP_001742277.1 hypothetical protein [Monosiga brevicollis MX1]